MNWDAVGAIGETVGAIAVIGSLVYLGIQIRIQNRESRLSAMHEIVASFREATAAVGHLDFLEIGLIASEDFESLPKTHQVLLLVRFVNLLRVCEEAYIQHDENRLDERYWAGIDSYLHTLIGIPSVRHVWARRKYQFDRHFQEYVDAIEAPEWEFSEPERKQVSR